MIDIHTAQNAKRNIYNIYILYIYDFCWKCLFDVIQATLYRIAIDLDSNEISRFGGLPRELYFPEVRSTEGNIVPMENIIILAPCTDTWYFIRPGRYMLYKMVKINWFSQNFMCSSLRLPRSLVTRLGVCVQNKTERKLDSLRASIMTFYKMVIMDPMCYGAVAWAGIMFF